MGSDRPQAFPLLDPLRGFAALAIVLVHTSLFSGGKEIPVLGDAMGFLDIGVPFFFLLSAFLLYRPFVLARRTGSERRSFIEYGKRRFVRIAPAYWAVLVLTAIVPGMAGAFSGNWWAYWSLLQVFPIYTPTGTCAVNAYECAVPVAWSLSVEVFFYALLPLIVVAMAWLGRRWRGRPLSLELGLVAVLSLASFAIQSSVPIGDLHTVLFFSPLGRGWWFALGLLLAAISVELQLRDRERDRETSGVGFVRRHPDVFIVTAFALYAVAALTFLRDGSPLAFPVVEQWRYFAQYILVGIVAALVMIPAVFGTDGGGWFRAVLRHRVLIWLGFISYGVFLWHFAVVIFLLKHDVTAFVPLTLLTLAITLCCASASYYLLERPLMRAVRSRPAPAGPAALESAEEELEEELADLGASSASSPSARA